MASGGVISRMRVFLGLDNKDFKKGLKESERKTSAFGDSIKKIGTAIAGAFAVKEIARFVGDLVKLAGEAEGVQRAFDRIGGNKVFDSLKTATRGTVSNLELMRKTVTAKNLGVPVKDLAKLFEFAAARAADTGESVDYLVNSIVVGIGRKSPLILDNLGISAIALKEKMNGVGIGTASVGQVAEAVGKIATEELNKIGNAATTNGQKLQSVSAAWDNIKLSIGRAITVSKEYKIISDIVLGINGSLGKTSKSQDKLAEGAKRIFDAWKAQGKLNKEFAAERIKALEKENKQLLWGDEFSKKTTRDRRKGNIKLIRLLKEVNAIPPKAIVEEIENITTLSEKIKALKVDQETATGSRLENINKEIESLKNYLSYLKLIGTTAAEIKPPKLLTPDDLPSQEPNKVVGQGMLTVDSGFFGGVDSTKNSEAREAEIAKQKTFVDEMNSITEGGMASLAEFTGEFIGAAITGDAGLEDFFSGILSQVGSFITQFGEALIAYGIASDAFKKAFSNPAVAIGAGIALVALGGILSNLGSTGPSGSSSGGSVTSIDARGSDSASRSASVNDYRRDVNINVQGVLKGTDIALSAKQGNKQLSR